MLQPPALMGTVAFIFPGQGSQKVGMGRATYDESAAGRQVFEAADAALGESLSRLCFEGPEEELKLTRNTQPAVLTTSIALWRALDATPDVVAGHSLGEYSANVVAGTVEFAQAVRLVRVRGELMQDAVPVGEGAMAAVMGPSADEVDEVCRDVDGLVEAVNYNSSGQTVIAGETKAVAIAARELRDRGGRVVDLPVSAPFHSSLMRPAEERLKPHLEATSFSEPRCTVFTNVDAAPAHTAGAARDALARQVSRPVRWEATVRNMAAAGVTLVVEIGEGTTLTSLVRRISSDIKRINVRSPADFDTALRAIEAARSEG